MSLMNMRVVTSIYLTESGTPYKIFLSWSERLFSWPWRPWVATRTIVPQVPYRGWMQLDKNTIVVHPDVLNQMHEVFAARKQ